MGRSATGATVSLCEAPPAVYPVHWSDPSAARCLASELHASLGLDLAREMPWRGTVTHGRQ